MNNYRGYLLCFGEEGIIPLNYIMEFTSKPMQRQENNAAVDQNGRLHRATMPHCRSSIKFTTHILTLDQKIHLQELMNYSVSLQRRVTVTYWNDELNTYSTGDFYLPDISFTVMDASAADILYSPLTIELIEY